jgi:hypothetical protein
VLFTHLKVLIGIIKAIPLPGQEQRQRLRLSLSFQTNKLAVGEVWQSGKHFAAAGFALSSGHPHSSISA